MATGETSLARNLSAQLTWAYRGMPRVVEMCGRCTRQVEGRCYRLRADLGRHLEHMFESS